MENIPLITYVPSIALSSDDYSHTLHTVGDNTIYVNITLALMEQFSWKQMAILTEVGLSNLKYVAEMKTQFSHRGYSLLEHSFKSQTNIDIMTVSELYLISVVFGFNLYTFLSQLIRQNFSKNIFIRKKSFYQKII